VSFAYFVTELFPNSNIKLLLNDQATLQEIQTQLLAARSPNQVCGGDLFIFYFSGHTFVSMENYRRYLGNTDLDPRNLETTALSPEDLYNALAQIEADKLVVVDSCFGGLEETSRPSDTLSKVDLGKAMLVSKNGTVENGLPPTKLQEAQLRRIRSHLAAFEGAALMFSAVDASAEAQEMFLVDDGSGDGKRVPTLLPPDPSASADQIKGHGLYTYYLLTALQHQMIKKHHHGTWHLDDGYGEERYSPDNLCLVDLNLANAKVREVLEKSDAFHYYYLLPPPGDHAAIALSGIFTHRK
jgi:hypothetical protein